MVEKGMSCVKYLLFAFNLVFFIIGAVLIGVGVYVQTQLQDYLAFFESANVNATAILIIVIGALTLIIGFFGCCGAIMESNWMVMTFAVLITIILVCEIGGGIAAFVLEGDIESLLSEGMMDTMKEYKTSPELWDYTQENLHCCGTDNITDWKGEVPNSCACKVDCKQGQVYYHKGCLEALEDFVEDNILIIGGIAIGLGVVEFLGIVLACCLGKAIRNEDRYV